MTFYSLLKQKSNKEQLGTILIIGKLTYWQTCEIQRSQKLFAEKCQTTVSKCYFAQQTGIINNRNCHQAKKSTAVP